VFTIVIPRELGRFFEQLYGKETGDGRETTDEALYFFDAGWASHLYDRVALFRVSLYAALGQHGPK